ncbi:MAG: DUF5996 family protein [Flavipsychrobacter sp.]
MKTWPELSYAKGKDTYATLHMWTQIVGKIKLALVPWQNHSWHVTLHITPTGLTTQTMPYKDKHFQIDFNFLKHQLEIITSDGKQKSFSLQHLSVAAFYEQLFSKLNELNIDVKIKPMPVELPDPIPFQQDTQHANYDEAQVTAFHQALLCIQDVFMRFRTRFKGKSSPIHFFWGSFDLAYSRFCGRRAPKHPGGIPHLPDSVAEEAYSHEVASSGFWTGNDMLPSPSFYAYIYPEPDGYKDATVQPTGAYYHKDLREFILPYEVVQTSNDPDAALLAFLNSTYLNCASLAEWNRSALE